MPPIKRDNAARTVRSRATEYKTRAEGDDLIIEGYFVVFGQPYQYWYGDEEVVDRHAFDDCDMTDVRALTDHVTHMVLGRTTSSTLTLTVDDYGLFGSIKVNAADGDATNLYARTQRGDVDQASFGFDEEEVEPVTLPDGRTRWIITRISKLWEISVCTFPAYEQTHVEARSHDGHAARVAAEIENLRKKLKHHA